MWPFGMGCRVRPCMRGCVVMAMPGTFVVTDEALLSRFLR